MKLYKLDRKSHGNSSFTAKINEFPYFLKLWHHHSELELVVILRSEGTCFIGDSIENFSTGDIVLIGKNLPHMYLNDDSYFEENSNKMASAIAIHFSEDFLGIPFLQSPEMIHLLEMFDRAKYGLKFLNVSKQVINQLKEMLELDGFERTISFLNILNKLSKHKSTRRLSSMGFVNSMQLNKGDIQEKVQAYIYNNFNKEISLDAAADVACMNPSAFSRFFKRMNRKTFSRYVAEIRIGYACKLLIESNYTIAEVCYESGYKNISNFNRQFKLITEITPSDYQSKYKIP